ncbi:MAG: hypothetical protein UR64_C0005G0010 [Candidatus Nomurabacteria bacterium GW2011_GWE1_35_16]|uniref:Uncharacterized protein n=1 Tax=Candidatus Nomurabacteria bacterium GW2011_GWE1_35_16 TaxID=1618761 RepID=A0A0G0BAU1_9BACT|nr:MAG: hypothetical protein UR64_C0005G0010 [Candidatus Nomurabacteria bacterium GW2011_GWE1_35_16]
MKCRKLATKAPEEQGPEIRDAETTESSAGADKGSAEVNENPEQK